MASEAVARRLTAAILAACSLVAGCSRDAGDVAVIWNVEPVPPVTATDTVVRVRIQDQQQQPVRGARLQVEAHMSHPGMAPVTAPMVERGPGAYEARVRLTMAGDWSIVLAGALADGARINRNTKVTAIERAEPSSASPGT